MRRDHGHVKQTVRVLIVCLNFKCIVVLNAHTLARTLIGVPLKGTMR